MQTLTIQADNADFIEKAREILITLAKFDGVKLNLSDEVKYQSRFSEY
ncbi:MAG: hypothetical protein HXK63_02465, partial [Campylobacter sp.]|nr:hypothetical protein [Campylobacter sp.]